jgi:hypothetical protein
MTALDRARTWFVTPTGEPAPRALPEYDARPSEITTAAVLGRPDEAEPVAAALALSWRARAAIVAVLDSLPAAPDVEISSPAPAGGTRAARRLSARLAAHGLVGRPRGRLVWVRVSASEAAVAVRRLAAMGAPVVVAVTAPRTAALDELLAELELIVVVTADPDGPLARLAVSAHPATRMLLALPLRRGPARSLARGGLRPARSVRQLLATGTIRQDRS